jgi:branched-subunit amino acid aminotransferase/4-amino-4-deoxychorismate lyase
MLVFLNGQIVKEEDAKISINDLSYQFGYGLFETIKCEEGIPLFFEAHYKRLTKGAKEIGMPFPVESEEVKSWIKDVLSANKLKSARIKILISKRVEAGIEKFNVLILPGELGLLPESYSLLGKSIYRDPRANSFVHKTTSRADSYIAYKEANESGFNDALFINEKNELIECTRANIFLVLEDKIITPELGSGILSGVTRTNVLDICKKENIILEEKKVNVLYLNKAKEVFITNAIIGAMPISRIKLEDKEYTFSNNSMTLKVKNAYGNLIQAYLQGKTSTVV